MLPIYPYILFPNYIYYFTQLFQNQGDTKVTLLANPAEDGVFLQECGVEFLKNLPESEAHLTHVGHRRHHQGPPGRSELQLKPVMRTTSTGTPLNICNLNY